MPDYLKSEGDGHIELILVQYPDTPRYEVRVYVADVPQDHRTLISTDSISDAEAVFRRRAAEL